MTDFEDLMGNASDFVIAMNNDHKFIAKNLEEINTYDFMEFVCETSMNELPITVAYKGIPVRIVDNFYSVEESVDYDRGFKCVVFAIHEEIFMIKTSGSSWIDEKEIQDWRVMRVIAKPVMTVEYEEIHDDY